MNVVKLGKMTAATSFILIDSIPHSEVAHDPDLNPLSLFLLTVALPTDMLDSSLLDLLDNCTSYLVSGQP